MAAPGRGGRVRRNGVSSRSCLALDVRPTRHHASSARSSMDRVLPSEGRGCWFDPSRAHQKSSIEQQLSELRDFCVAAVRKSYGNAQSLILPSKPGVSLPFSVERCVLQLVSKNVAVQRDSDEPRFHDTKLTLRSSPGNSSIETRQSGANPA